MPLDRAWRKIQRPRSFFDGEAAEKSQLHNATLLLIEFRQFLESVVERHHINVAGFELKRVIQRQPESAIALGGIPAARVLDQNLPHQLGADGHEMITILKWSCALFFQAQISLVHQGGALQGVARAFLPQVMMRDPSQLVINQRKRPAQGLVVTGVPVRQ